MTIAAKWAAVTHAGAVREQNQDAIVDVPPVFAVADGMGGHAAGDVASQIAVRHLSAFAGAAAIDSESAIAACRAANAEILQRSRNDTALAGMGTTVAGVALSRTADGDRVLVFNAGDSRIYRSTGGRLVQVSEDHSVVAELIASHAISEAEAREHPQRNIVTRVLGVEDDVYIDTWVFDATPDNQRFLICSDGLTNELTDDEIREVLRGDQTPDTCASALLAAALAHGARDNVSVVIVDVWSTNEAITSLDAETAPRSALLAPPAVAEAAEVPPAARAGLITDVPQFSRGSL